MSGQTDDSSAFRKSKRPKPARGPSDGEEPTTFRPNPNRTSKAKPRSGEPNARVLDPGKGPGLWERIFFGRVGSGQLATFCRQLSAYLNAGVDIGKALANLETQFRMTALGPVIGRLRTAVKAGDSIAESVAREPQAFDPLFLGMIRVAEARGGVPETLRLLGRHYENRQSLIRQARAAMIYPIAVLVIASFVIALFTLWLLPMFAELLKDIAGPGTVLPLPSRVLMSISAFVRSAGWLVIPLVMIGTPILLLKLYRTGPGKQCMDRLALWIPVFGALVRKIDTSRFARTLSALLNAGVDVGSSLELTSDVLHLEPYKQAIRDTRAQVIQGGELSEALQKTGRFGPDVIAVVNSGEETGKLPESLDHLADDYEEQVAYMVKNMGQLIQPLLMILLGGIVLFIILAVLLPYISVITNLAH
jgi:type II secretory pathway component PulF